MPKISRIHWKKFEKFLFKIGCVFKRQAGDHLIYWKSGIKRPLVVPKITDIPEMVVLNNLKTLGVSREEYFKIIEKI